MNNLKEAGEMKRLRRFEVALIGALVCVSACTAIDPAEPRNADGPQMAVVAPIRKESLRLVPQPEGTPLPPRDPSIADGWPPEIKELVDNMLTLFPKTPDERPPSVRDVEQKIGITLTERQLLANEMRIWSKRYEVSGTRYMDPSLRDQGGFGLGEFYGITREKSPGKMIQALQLVLSPKQSGFCLNPYELAVYTGSKFKNGDTSPHATVIFWPPAYVWGMFAWSNTGSYEGQGFDILIGSNRNSPGQEITGFICVHALSVYGLHQKEEQQ